MFSRVREWYIAAIGLLLIAGGLYFASQQTSDGGAKNAEAKQTANVTAPGAAKAPNSQSRSSSQEPPKSEAAPVNKAPSSPAASAAPAAVPLVAQSAAPAAHNHSAADTTNIAQTPAAAAPTPTPAWQPSSNVGATPTAIAGGDPAAGKLVFRKCQVCHSLEPGKDVLGPSLAGIIGRKSGAEPNYAYSPAIKGANLTWDAKTLDAYLDDPQKFVPGNKMPFPGIKTPQDRSDLIAFIAAPAGSVAVQSTSAAAAQPPGAQAQPNAPAPIAAYIPDAKYTLRSGIAEGRMVYIGVGGAIDGKVNPVLTAAEGQVVQLTLIQWRGGRARYRVSGSGCEVAARDREKRKYDDCISCD